jgi:hypothetical protein
MLWMDIINKRKEVKVKDLAGIIGKLSYLRL